MDGDVFEHDVAQGFGVGDRDVDEEVVLPRDMEHLQHARDGDEGGVERRHQGLRVGSESDLDHGRERSPECRGIHAQHGRSDDPACTQ